MKALIIGFGKMGMLHAATLRAIADIKEMTVCESSSTVREGLKKFQPDMRVAANLDEALNNSTYDIAVIATPTDSHAEIFRRLMEKSCHTFIEKPLTTTVDEANKFLEWSQNSRIKVMVGHCLRFVPTFETAKAHLQNNLLGRVQSFKAQMNSSDVTAASSGWRFDTAQKGGGVLLDLGSHLVDMVRYLFGVPDVVKGATTKIVSKEVEDAFTAEFIYPSSQGTLESSWSTEGVRKPSLEIEINCDEGNLKVADDQIILDLKSGRGIWGPGIHTKSITELEKPVPFDLAGPFYTRQLMEWIEAIKENKTHRNDLGENVQNHLLIDMIRNST